MKLMKLNPQTPPFSIQIEPTEGCNLGCSFCGLQGMKKKGKTPWNFMTLETAERIASEVERVGWHSKFIFAMHGEPTLNKHLFEIINIFHEHRPDALKYVISNGCGIVHSEDILEYVKLLKEVGVNHLLLDNYSDDGDWSKVVKAVGNEFEILTLQRGIPMFSPKKKFDILVMPSIREVKIGSVRNLKNHCGAAFPPAEGFAEKRCTMPFREMSFRWNGNVAICCDDFRGEYPIGNIFDMGIEELWNHERFQVARVMIYNNERGFHPCNICNNMSMRVGLLPDPMGKETLPGITKEVRRIAESVSEENEPFATIVKRPWENGKTE